MTIRIQKQKLYLVRGWRYEGISGYQRKTRYEAIVRGSLVRSRYDVNDVVGEWNTPGAYSPSALYRVDNGRLPEFRPSVYGNNIASFMGGYYGVSPRYNEAHRINLGDA